MKLGAAAILRAFGVAESTGVQTPVAAWDAFLDQRRMTGDELLRRVGPNSVDVTLGPTILELDPTRPETVDLRANASSALSWIQLTCTKGYVLEPGGFCLAHVRERFVVDAPLAGVCADKNELAFFAPFYEGRSTMGRIGLGSHITAGFGDYGFRGAFTLELSNSLSRPIRIYSGLRIGQICFEHIVDHGRYFYDGSYSSADHYSGPVVPNLDVGRLFYLDEERT